MSANTLSNRNLVPKNNIDESSLATIENVTIPGLNDRLDVIENTTIPDLDSRIDALPTTELSNRVTAVEGGGIEATLDPGTDNTYTLGTATNPYRRIFYRPVYKFWRANSTTIPHNTETPINWSAVMGENDTDSLLEHPTGSKFVFPVAGVYDFTCTIRFNLTSGPGSVGQRTLKCVQNSGKVIANKTRAVVFINILLSCSGTFVATENSSIEFIAYQNSGASMPILTTSREGHLLITLRNTL